MKHYSITRRVVSLVLAVEFIAAVGVTAFAFFYERHAQFRSFDISLRGHADTVMGAVEDADDSKLGVMLDSTDLNFPRRDVYAVREEGAKDLGHSPNWTPDAENWEGPSGLFSLKVNGRSYRALRLRGVRVVDPMAANVRHPLMVLYASPTHEVWEAVSGAVQVFALANGLLLLLTALLVPPLVRRSMSPLHLLAADAGGVTSNSWQFDPAKSVRQVVELHPLVAAMEGVLHRLERSFTQQQQFVGDAAHELKTAIAVVKSSIQLLELRARTPAEYEAGLQRSYSDCLRMEDLAQNMLLMARVEEQGSAPAPACTDIGSVVTAAITELAPLASLRKVKLVEGLMAYRSVPVENELLRSLIVNLLTNAIQHSPAGSTVAVHAEQKPTWIELSIEDTGDGIPPESLPFVFDRFYRSDVSRSRKSGGTGLGLAICKAIVERAHGTILITSAIGTGTRVDVTLPVLQER